MKKLVNVGYDPASLICCAWLQEVQDYTHGVQSWEGAGTLDVMNSDDNQEGGNTHESFFPFLCSIKKSTDSPSYVLGA